MPTVSGKKLPPRESLNRRGFFVAGRVEVEPTTNGDITRTISIFLLFAKNNQGQVSRFVLGIFPMSPVTFFPFLF
jgi:hypothetical protein